MTRAQVPRSVIAGSLERVDRILRFIVVGSLPMYVFFASSIPINTPRYLIPINNERQAQGYSNRPDVVHGAYVVENDNPRSRIEISTYLSESVMVIITLRAVGFQNTSNVQTI